MDGDRPITTSAEDRLGFSPVAEKLALAIADRSARDGFVVGIEGRWGSGKSSLINLTIDALRNRVVAPEIVEFSPWLIGDRDQLLINLFDSLASAALRIEPIDPGDAEVSVSLWERLKGRVWGDGYTRLRRKEKLKEKLASKLRSFGALAGTTAKFIKFAAYVGTPYAEKVGSAIEHGGKAAGSLFDKASLADRRLEIVAALRLLSRPIVIFVDDLDRLEPQEVNEVLRLVRAVADFPNVIYVLSYDPEVL